MDIALIMKKATKTETHHTTKIWDVTFHIKTHLKPHFNMKKGDTPQKHF